MFAHHRSTMAAACSALATMAIALSAAAAEVEWTMSGMTRTTPTLVKEAIEDVTGGAVQIDLKKPGELFPALELLDAVSDGRVQVGHAPLGFWTKDIPAAALFTAVPFGPGAPEYLAWIGHGGGAEILDEVMAARGIHVVACGISVPEASGWFRSEITSLDDLKGLKMRFFGLGALVMSKLGVETTILAPADILPALESGEIDATEFSTPAADLDRGFHKVAKHYYFPGWHQPHTLSSLMVREDAWAALSETQQAQVEAACASRLMAQLAEDEASQFAAIEQLKAEGVQVHRWPDEMLAAFETAWSEVADELTAKDPDFARAWQSLNAFREQYAVWHDLATVD